MSQCAAVKRDASPDRPQQKRVIKENTSTALPIDTHYKTLYLNFSHAAESIPRVRTYEGVDLCCHCLQFRRQTHFSKSRVGGAKCGEPLPRNTSPCQHCGMPIKVQKSGNDKVRHMEVRGAQKRSVCDIFRDLGAMDEPLQVHKALKSLVCPGCTVPGFNLEELRAHLRRNPDGCGDRKEFAKTMQSACHFQAVQCSQCGFWLNKAVLYTHVCGSDLDPIWLGMDNEMPDLSRPYPVWGDDLPEPYGPTGYGGGCIREDGQGRIPKEILTESWHAPFATTSRYSEGYIQEGDLLDLIHCMNQLTANDELMRIHYADPAATNYSQDWSVALATLPLHNKLRILHAEVQHLTTIKHQQLLLTHGITYDKLATTKCPGFGWVHGHVRCRHKADLDLGSVILRACNTEKQVRLVVPHCRSCNSDSLAIQRWMQHSKYNAAHQRLCTNPSCLKVLETAVDCEEHQAKRLKAAFDFKQRALQKRLNIRPKWNKRSNLWRIINRDNMATFFHGLSKLNTGPWKWHQHWAHVAASMISDDYAGPKIFHCDTESFYIIDKDDANAKKTLKPLEICILDRRGKVLLNTTVDYSMPIAQLMQDSIPSFTAKACDIYGAQNAAQMTKGMTPGEIQEDFTKLGIRQKGCILVEHSSGVWDGKALVNVVGKELVPGTQLTTFELLRLLSYAGPKDLQVLFLLAYPASRINQMQHRALWDACKMFVIIKCVFMHRIIEEGEFAGLLTACDNFQGKHTAGDACTEKELMAEVEAETKTELANEEDEAGKK